MGAYNSSQVKGKTWYPQSAHSCVAPHVGSADTGATQAPVLSCAFFAALKVFEGQTGDLLHVCQVRVLRRLVLASVPARQGASASDLAVLGRTRCSSW